MSPRTLGLDDCSPVVVTGAGGLLGSHLVAELGMRFPACQLLTPNRQELDLENGNSVLNYWQEQRPHGVFHLAAFVLGLGGNLSAGVTAFAANARINHNVLMASLSFPPQFLFAAGTVASYPYPYPRLPLVEEDAFLSEPHQGEYYYGLAKRAILPYLQALSKSGGTNTILGLFTNMYGPGDNFNEVSGHVIPSLVKRFVEAQRVGQAEVLVWGSPDTTRDFLYVKDAVSGLLLTLGSGLDLCNIASGHEITMGELVETLCRVTDYQGAVIWDASKPVGIPRRSVDISRLTKIGGGAAPTPLADGLRATVEWYRQHC